MTISFGLCWNIDSRQIIWPPQAHFGSENESLKGLSMKTFCNQQLSFKPLKTRWESTQMTDDSR